jgi:hypothetical protein
MLGPKVQLVRQLIQLPVLKVRLDQLVRQVQLVRQDLKVRLDHRDHRVVFKDQPDHQVSLEISVHRAQQVQSVPLVQQVKLEYKVRPDLQDRVMDRLVHKDQQVLLVPVMVQLDPLVHKAQLVLLE